MKQTLFYMCTFVILLFGCQEQAKEHIAIGSWYICFENGNYQEYKFTENHLLIWRENNDISIYKNKVIDSTLIISNHSTPYTLPVNNDTLITIAKTKESITLRSTTSWEIYKFKKLGVDLLDVDSLNLKNWQKLTLKDYNKRLTINCLDTRPEEEKIIDKLDMSDIELEDIEIIEIDSN
ncbi:hypothetical protein [Winogradskyella sp.]|uniref:hypothetical protein n=1 Tax=Winogradskyella sp. TaxID=1883156 RepID=UPI001B2C891F|nr:hypothetical protein [Winogradskyella sp.]MBO6880184.1 hypothetical protein [Winogradskyella sp.]